jgi:hypothetical protein
LNVVDQVEVGLSNSSNVHTLLTQLIATAGLIAATFHFGSGSFTVPDAVLAAASTLTAAVASGLHSIGKRPVVLPAIPSIPAPVVSTPIVTVNPVTESSPA